MEKIFDESILSEEDISEICKKMLTSKKASLIRKKWINGVLEALGKPSCPLKEREAYLILLSMIGYSPPIPLSPLAEYLSPEIEAFSAMMVYTSHAILEKLLKVKREELEKEGILTLVEKEVERLRELIG